MANVRPCCRYGLGSVDPVSIAPAQIAAYAGDLGPLQALDAENAQDRAARIATIVNDPSTIQSIRTLALHPLYNTFVGDFLYNNPQFPTPSWISQADRDSYTQLLGGVVRAAQTQPPPPPPPQAPARYLINGVEQYADGTPVPGGYNAHDDAVRQLREQGYPNPTVGADGTVIDPGPPAGPGVDAPAVSLFGDGPLTAGMGGLAGWLAAGALVGAILMRKRS